MKEKIESRLESEQELKQEVLEIIKNETREKLKNFNECHGWEHTGLVAENALIIAFFEIKCIIDDINSCLDWVTMIETASAKRLINKLKEITRALLKLFTNHQEITDRKLWLDFVRSSANDFRQKKRRFYEEFSLDKQSGRF